jgi:hypothetical protein
VHPYFRASQPPRTSQGQRKENIDVDTAVLHFVIETPAKGFSITQKTRQIKARAVLKRLVAGFPPRRPGIEPGSVHVGFVVDKVALGQVFSKYFGFPCQFAFHRLLHNHHHLSPGAGTIGRSTKWTQSHPMRKTNSKVNRNRQIIRIKKL